eukprot:4832197-Alexandrium_andersonii.AAC.1
MSASLVGSEMCIRDRDGACLRGACRIVVLRARCSCGVRASERTRTQAKSCLLYTSDAADDM